MARALLVIASKFIRAGDCPIAMPDKKQSQAILGEFAPLSLAKMLWNRRWMAMGLWVLATATAIVVVRQLHPVYKADVLVLVDSQKIPDRFVASTVDEDLADSLALISQEIMSRTRLTRIIDMFDLYKQERTTKTQEEIIQLMRKDVSLKVEHGAGGGKMGAFRLGYQGANPVVVAKVANELANLYVTENLRTRQDQAEGTVQFLQTQVNDAKKSLSEQEAKVSAFKQKYNGVLPQQENSLLTTLSNLRVQLEGSQEALNRSQAEEEMTQTALSSAEFSAATLEQSLRPKVRSIEAPGDVSGSIAAPRSEVLERQLHELLRRYTPQHPAVQALRADLAEARREESEAATAMAQAAKSRKSSSSLATDDQITSFNPELLHERERIATLKTQLATIKRSIGIETEARQQELATIASVEERVNRLPLVEQQMAALTRNYQTSQENYKSLLDKEFAAGIATQMERSQKSERFTVMDPARIPEKPFKPKRLVIEAAGSLGGLILGALLGVGLEWRKKHLMGEWELPPDVLILGRVPRIEISPKKVAFRRTEPSLCLVIWGMLLAHSWATGLGVLQG